MNSNFIAILQKLIAEQGKDALLNPAKCKAFLGDYTRGDCKRESRWLLQVIEAGAPKENICQKCGKELQEDWTACPYCTTPVTAAEQQKMINNVPGKTNKYELIIPCIYMGPSSFSEGLAYVRRGNYITGKWGFIGRVDAN